MSQWVGDIGLDTKNTHKTNSMDLLQVIQENQVLSYKIQVVGKCKSSYKSQNKYE